MQVIQSQLADVGIALNIITMEWGTFSSEWWGTGDMTIGLYGFANMIADGDLPLFNRFHTSAWGGVYYGNEELDELIEAQQEELDPEEREAILHEIVREVVNNAARAELFRYKDLYGVKEGLEWFPRNDQRVLLYELP
jgi:ABC-type transport system substrate-binding protein